MYNITDCHIPYIYRLQTDDMHGDQHVQLHQGWIYSHIVLITILIIILFISFKFCCSIENALLTYGSL